MTMLSFSDCSPMVWGATWHVTGSLRLDVAGSIVLLVAPRDATHAPRYFQAYWWHSPACYQPSQQLSDYVPAIPYAPLVVTRASMLVHMWTEYSQVHWMGNESGQVILECEYPGIVIWYLSLTTRGQNSSCWWRHKGVPYSYVVRYCMGKSSCYHCN